MKFYTYNFQYVIDLWLKRHILIQIEKNDKSQKARTFSAKNGVEREHFDLSF